MTDQYIESKLMTAEASARDLLAWNSIRAEERLAGSPHLRLFTRADIENIKNPYEKVKPKNIKEILDNRDIFYFLDHGQ